MATCMWAGLQTKEDIGIIFRAYDDPMIGLGYAVTGYMVCCVVA